MSVLPPDARLLKKHVLKIALIGVILLVLGAGWLVYEKLFRKVPQQYSQGTALAFKYGSIGVEEEAGIPYWIWLVLPRVFPEHLPGAGGYTSLGMVWDPQDEQEMPVGFSKMRIGYERVAINCAICHTATYRHHRTDGRASNTQIVAGGPTNRFDPQRYLAFLRSCAEDPKFNADTILGAIDYNVQLSTIDRMLFRYLLIPSTKQAILEQSANNRWMQSRPIWGPGRIDPFNPVKFGMLKMDPNADASIGNSDMMPLWELAKRQAGDGSWHLHWDGLVTDPLNCSLAGALGDGASAKSLPVEGIEKLVSDYLMPLPAPKLSIDRGGLAAGRAVFNAHCAQCHGAGGDYTNTVVTRKLPETNLLGNGQSPSIGTDNNRLLMWNPVKLKNPLRPDDALHPATIYNQFYDWNRPSFVGTHGYVSVPLNGIWLRAPYLHNGSVPTLEDLLNPPMNEAELQKMMEIVNLKIVATGREPVDYQQLRDSFSRLPDGSQPPENVAARLSQLTSLVDSSIAIARSMKRRPPMFYRGYDVLDPERTGFIHDSRAAEGRRFPVPYLTAVQGNSNQGHLWGTDISSEEDKNALIEYLISL